MRMRISSWAKWLLLIAIVCFTFWLPMHLYWLHPTDWLSSKPGILHPDKDFHDIIANAAAVVLAGVLVTGILRAFLPGIFGHWHEAVEAFRDWLVVGLVTGVLYNFGVVLAKKNTS